MRISAAGWLLLCFICAANAHNITKILDGFPEYSKFNSYLTQTKLADEINSRTTITVLVVDNGAMSTLESKGLGLSGIKRVLSLHVLLDYFDPSKLHEITNGTTLSTTLLQTTGAAPGNSGFLNVTDLKGGKVGFGTATPGSKLSASFVKSVKEVPFNISVIQISQLVFPSLAEAPSPAPSEVNITAVLLKFGHKTFANLIKTTGVLKTYEEDVVGGLTIFAPADAAFTAVQSSLKKLSNADVISVLEYHAMPVYNPLGSLKTTNGPIRTLATTTPSKYVLTVSSSGDTVMLNTGVDKATITRTLVDDQPLAIFSVDKLLQPKELFTAPPAPAPAPALASTPESSSPPSPSPASKSSASSAAGPADGPASPDTTKDASFAPGSNAGGVFLSVAAGLACGVLML